MKRYRSICCAFEGIKMVFASEVNAQIHLMAMILVIVAGWFFDITVVEWSLVMLACGMVISAEIMNTAIEYLCDLVSSEYHPLIKKAKDAAAGAVLWMALTAIVIGGIIFIPYLYALFFL